jgi:hypothetical protein
LERSLTKVCDRLGLDRDRVGAFVHNSSDLQATCYFTFEDQCLLRFSSSLVNLLEEDEFSFVAGHELGHFLLEHSAIGVKERSLEYFVFQRAQEISADRIGLLACQDENAAARALIKTVSGLESRHLQLDVGQFLSQLSRVERHSKSDHVFSTHPSMLVRTRSLMWFAMAKIHKSMTTERSKDLDKIDQRVARDLAKYVDGKALEGISNAKSEIEIWLAASIIISDNRFNVEEQKKFLQLFGDDLLVKLKNFLSSAPSGSVQDMVLARLSESKRRLEELAPVEYPQTYKKIKKKVLSHFQVI